MKLVKYRLRKGASLLFIAVCILSLLLSGCGSGNGSPSSIPTEEEPEKIPAASPTTVPETVSKSPTEEQAAHVALQFPYQLEDGKLEVVSLFQFTGLNPDCGQEAGTDIASLSFINTSAEHLTSAVFTVSLADGTQFRFAAADVPAGASVLAFSTDNAVYDPSVSCEAITCEAVFEAVTPLMEESVSVSVDGTSVTITNLTDEDLTNLAICCHTLFDGELFGGLTYGFSVKRVEAGGSITFQAESCYLGEAAVVRITQVS